MRSQLTFYEESIRQKKQPRPRFHPAFRLLWVLLSRVWSGWKSAAEAMKPKTVLQWHEHAFLKWWRWKSRRKGGRPTINQEMRALIRRFSRENVLWSAETIHGHLVLLDFDPPCPDTIRKYMVNTRGGENGQVPNLVPSCEITSKCPGPWTSSLFLLFAFKSSTSL